MTSYDASTDPQLTLLGAVLAHLLEHARRHDVDVLLVGAAARDVLIRHATGALPQRATADVDIAVAVADWAAYTRLTAELSPAGRSSHTFRVADIEVDIVPFGGIESADRTISWPDGYVMNTLGFREALGCAITVTLPGAATVKVASLPAQAVLKLHAWRDRRLITTRDAIDLRTILQTYSDGPYLDRLYDASEHILAAYDFDPQLAGAHRLGVELRNTLGAAIAEDCRQIIAAEADRDDRLAAEMGGSIEHNRLLLNATSAGAASDGNET
ncbi:MAG TPA: nucleotidyl transferase AbiEii/AbiGii toxin family protein [Jatrophihabitantaceae bacterium]|nr:nucleotidyl transferase AbiEii/AbiGii toxin family protein [Jatrophihabitantaceae bacterium]